MAQLPFSRKSFAIVQALFGNLCENRSLDKPRVNAHRQPPNAFVKIDGVPLSVFFAAIWR
jgi:hypothetical protein